MSSFPKNLGEIIKAGEVPVQGWYANDGECAGAKFHSPQPLVLHDVSLNAADPTDGRLSALLCGTCADNLKVLQKLMVIHEGRVPWPVRREFGNQIRALAEQGWEEAQ